MQIWHKSEILLSLIRIIRFPICAKLTSTMSEEHKREDSIYPMAQAVIMFGPNADSIHKYTASEITQHLNPVRPSRRQPDIRCDERFDYPKTATAYIIGRREKICWWFVSARLRSVRKVFEFCSWYVIDINKVKYLYSAEYVENSCIRYQETFVYCPVIVIMI